MNYLVCYRIRMGKQTMHGDIITNIPRSAPANIEKLRNNLREKLIKETISRKEMNLKKEDIGKLVFTSLTALDPGPIPKKSGIPEKEKKQTPRPISRPPGRNGHSL